LIAVCPKADEKPGAPRTIAGPRKDTRQISEVFTRWVVVIITVTIHHVNTGHRPGLIGQGSTKRRPTMGRIFRGLRMGPWFRYGFPHRKRKKLAAPTAPIVNRDR